MSFNALQLESALRGGRQGAEIPPLAEDGKPVSFRELMGRAQLQTAAAIEAINGKRWGAVKTVVESLQETARAFANATKVPEDFQERIESFASDLVSQVDELSSQVAARNSEKAEENLRQIQGLLGDQELVPLWVRIEEPVRFFALTNQAQGEVAGRFDLSTLNPMEAFMAYFKVSLVCGLVLGSPWIFIQIWAFIAAGLYPHEKRLVNVYLPFSLILFLTGALVCQFVVIPKAVNALLWFNQWLDLEPELRFNEWLSFAILMPLVFGISFQLPLVMMFLERLGIMTVQMYYSYWKIAFFLIHVVAAVLMPSPDPMSMECLALPMFGLYGLGILLCRLNPGKSEQDQDVPQSEEMVEV
jgi:Tat protein translocase TatC